MGIVRSTRSALLLERLEQLELRASPAPWRSGPDGLLHDASSRKVADVGAADPADVDLIVTFRNLASDLLLCARDAQTAAKTEHERADLLASNARAWRERADANLDELRAAREKLAEVTAERDELRRRAQLASTTRARRSNAA